jgi:hypothetical protein
LKLLSNRIKTASGYTLRRRETSETQEAACASHEALTWGARPPVLTSASRFAGRILDLLVSLPRLRR